MRTFLLIAAVAAWSASARADWEYTRWGMTADQVIAASHGAASMMPEARRFRDEADHFEITVQAKPSGPPVSDIGFEFDLPGGGLRCVIYNATGNDVDALRAQMVQRYGKPTKNSGDETMREMIWKTPDEIDMAMIGKPKGAAVNHCAPGKN